MVRLADPDNPYTPKPHRSELRQRRHARRRDTFRSVRDVAAQACGMVHHDGCLLMPVPIEIALRDRLPIEEGKPCLINSL